MKRPLYVILAVAVVAVLVVGIVQTGGNQDSQGGRGPAPAAAGKALAGSPPALAALHHDANALLPAAGFDARLLALRGHPVVVNVWGSWCGPCREEFPIFERVSVERGPPRGVRRDRHPGREGQGRRLPRRAPGRLPQLPGLRRRAGQGHRPDRARPATVFIDARGKRTYLHQGKYLTDAALKADIRRYTGA